MATKSDAARLTPEEAAEVARLHAERLVAEPSSPVRGRETSRRSAEEVARRIGATSEEVQALAAEVRRRDHPRSRRVSRTELSGGSAIARTIRGAGIWMMVGALVGSVAAINVAERFAPPPPRRATKKAPAPAGATSTSRPASPAAGNPSHGLGQSGPAASATAASMAIPFLPDTAAKADPNRPTVGPKRIPLSTGPFMTEPILSSAVVPPPPGYAVYIRTSQRRLFIAGAPETKGTLAPKAILEGVRKTLRSAAKYVELIDVPPSSPTSLTFPLAPDEAGGFFGLEGFHSVEVRSARGSVYTRLPDHRYVRKPDEASYRSAFDARVDALFDGQSVPTLSRWLRRRATAVKPKTNLPKGTAVVIEWSGGRRYAEGDGAPEAVGDSVESAVVEMLQEAYRDGGDPTTPFRAIVEVPGDTFECVLLPYEFGAVDPPEGASVPPGVRIGWFNELATLAYRRK